MSNIDNTLIRQRVIDKCLRSIKKYTMADMMDACNHELQLYGEPPVTATNTIRNDVKKISTVYPDAVIIPEREGRNIYYRYKDTNYSIFNIPFKDEELVQLTQTLSILSRFEGMPQFEWMDEFIQKFKSSINMDRINEAIVGFDENIDLKGRNYFAGLFTAIVDKQVLSLSYKNFKKNIVQQFTIYPYYLKQYNRRWFLLARSEGYIGLSVFAFDRIVNFEPVHKEYIPNMEYDFNEYFDDMVGVSKYDSNMETVKLWVSAVRWSYVDTKPLHGSQKVLTKDDLGTVVQIQVYVNKELEQLILGYGKDMKVIEPLYLKERIKANIEDCMRNYK